MRSVTAWISWSAIVFCWVAAASADPPLRVAVIDAGAEAATPPLLVDLLSLHLGEHDRFAVLERRDLDAVIREQKLRLSLADDAARDKLAATGSILGADALVLLYATPTTDNSKHLVRARVVETRRGVRCGETVLVIPTAEPFPEQAAASAERLQLLLDRVRDVDEGFLVVALSGLSGEATSIEAVRLRRDLQTGLEAWLAAQPGIAVAERRGVLPVVDERRVASDLPAAFGDADVVVNGDLQLDFSSTPPAVTLRLRVPGREGNLSEEVVQTRYQNANQLREEAGKAVLRLLSRKPATTFHAENEAKLLADEAQRLLEFWRHYEALERLSAAYAFAPDNRLVQALLLRAGRGVGVGPDPSGDVFRGAFYPTLMMLCDAGRRMLDRIEEPIPGADQNRTLRRGALLASIGDLCKMMSQVQFVAKRQDETDPVQHEWVRAAVSDLYGRYLAAARSVGGQTYEAALFRGLQSGLYWAESPRRALEQRRELFEAAAELEEFSPFGGWCFTTDHRFRVGKLSESESHPDLDELHDHHFRELANSRSPLVRAVGLREAANDALWRLQDPNLAMERYRGFIRIITEEIIPSGSAWADETHALWLDLNHTTGLLALSPADAGDLWRRVLLARWLPEPPRNPQPWEYRIRKTVMSLEKANKPREASELIDRLAQSLNDRAEKVLTSARKQPHEGGSHEHRARLANAKHHAQRLASSRKRLLKLQSKLLERHPALARDDRPSDEGLTAACRVVLLARELAESSPPKQPSSGAPVFWQFRGLVRDRDGFALYEVGQLFRRTKKAATRSRPSRTEAPAVVWLNAEGRVRKIDRFGEPIEYEDRRSRLVGGPWGPNPAFISTEAGIFLGPPMGGVLWFRPDGTTVHFASSHLESPDPHHVAVPFEEVHQLVAADGKLYVVAGGLPRLSTIYELDYRKAVCKQLVSTESLPSNHALLGREMLALLPGPPGKLLVWGHEGQGDLLPRSGGLRSDLFVMDLADGKVTDIPQPVQAPFGFRIRSPLHRLAHTVGDKLLAVYDPRRMDFTLLTKDAEVKVRRLQHRQGARAIALAENARFLVTRTQDAWRVHYRDGTPSRRLEAEGLPEPYRVVSFLIDENDRIWMLTFDKLYQVTLPD